MRITFLKNEDNNYYFAYDISPNAGYYFHFHKSVSDVLEKCIHEHFDPEFVIVDRPIDEVEAYGETTTFTVQFKRAEDEAFFLLWSNDGIEI
jgi:hypothetical protein